MAQNEFDDFEREPSVVDAAHFLPQSDTGRGDYSVERYQLLNHLTQEDIIAQINALQRRKSE